MRKTNMHNCRFCKNPLRPWAEWKGEDGQLYCNEFCADAAGATDIPLISGPPELLAAFRTPHA